MKLFVYGLSLAFILGVFAALVCFVAPFYLSPVEATMVMYGALALATGVCVFMGEC